ncbi:TetR/AcrR family transcriptional regulator [Streptomyces sp. NPDC005551]|uniref:TetR/AcrR family transcriptional regulator n=1 Tax=unclassified Streptomyces TaxID=2593676 RepID=UPI003401B006
MGRVSKDQARENRQRVVASASRLFREQGTDGVSVADLMKAAGLTHGGFYKQFASKEALVDEATAHAFTTLEERLGDALGAHGGDPAAARGDLIDYYLSPEHRDDPAGGCPTVALAADMSRSPHEGTAHETYTEGVRRFAAWLATAEDDGLARLSTLVGALMLARAVKGDPLSDEILAAARTQVTT